jgi:AraC-like DNA-binding protein
MTWFDRLGVVSKARRSNQNIEGWVLCANSDDGRTRNLCVKWGGARTSRSSQILNLAVALVADFVETWCCMSTRHRGFGGVRLRRLVSQQPAPFRSADCLGSAVDVVLVEDALQMRLDRADGDAQAPRDRLVTHLFDDKSENLFLAGRQRVAAHALCQPQAVSLQRAWPEGIRAAIPVECRESDLADVVDEVSRDSVPRTIGIVARPPRGGLASGALRRVTQHIDQHPSEAIMLNELAQIAGLSVCHFARAFKESVGIAPHRFMTVRRIAAACRLLAEGDDALIQIALEVGFCDQSHFTRCFSQFVGVTPSAYRRRYR